MRVFVTGASGFVGSAIVNELIAAGIEVVGLVRSESAAEKLREAGSEALLGDVNDRSVIRQGAISCDAVIHTAFNHDFSQYKASCEADRIVIETFGEALAGTGKPLVITSGIGLLQAEGGLITEDAKLPFGSDTIPRAASEEAAEAARAKGADVYVVRLPPTVHGRGDHGFIPMIIGMAKENGRSAYIGDGLNRWSAVHRFDAAALYRLIVEQKPEQKVFNAVAEEGIPFKDIAGAIGKGLGLPVAGLVGEAVEKHFTWFAHFASLHCAASSAKAAALGWRPKQIGLLNDLEENYF